jgi:hypothetical protein
MPIHLNYQGTTCSECGAEFIAYSDNCVCPKCGARAAESFGFVEATIATMKDHKQLYGNYFPAAWFSGSAADLVQGMVFEIFDNLEAEKPKDAPDFISRQLADIEFEEGMEHLAAQVRQIALEVYEVYRNDPDFRAGALNDKPLNPKLKEFKESLDQEAFPLDNF